MMNKLLKTIGACLFLASIVMVSSCQDEVLETSSSNIEKRQVPDIEDENEFLTAYADFKKEYDGVFVYNSENQYDLSPYYSFDDEKAELLGNINGAVIIGNNYGMQIMLQQEAF